MAKAKLTVGQLAIKKGTGSKYKIFSVDSTSTPNPIVVFKRQTTSWWNREDEFITLPLASHADVFIVVESIPGPRK